MTTKAEEVRTQEAVEEFLKDLITGKIKRVPLIVRERARILLKHFATPTTVERGSIH